jgi:apolipoprotein N-acyltransferase
MRTDGAVSRNFFVLAAIVALAGLGQAVSIASPWDGQPQWWLQIASLTVLAVCVHRESSVRRAFAFGWLFATAWLCATFWWLFISMHIYGGMAAPLAAVAVLALAAALSLYYALACAAFVRVAGAAWWMRAGLFASLWLLAELLRGHWFTGFPWGAGGYAHVDGPLAPLAPLVGVYGIGFVGALLSFAIAFALVRGPRATRALPVALGVLLVAALQFTGDDATLDAQDGRNTGTLQVALLQGNIPQDEKFQPGTGVPLALAWYAARLGSTDAPLVIAPETALPLLPRALPEGYWRGIQSQFASGQRAALIGVPLGSVEDGYSNSVVGLRAGAPYYRYDKHHLVPFGEFVPSLFRWFTNLMNIPLGDFDRGAASQAPFEWQGQRLMPNICYEDLFGEEIAVHFADGKPAPTVLVNVSNIGWFGNSIAIDQHLHISRMRSLEFARPMLRATNTGATAIIDHRGEVLQLLPRHTRGVLMGEVQGRSGRTAYAAWASRFGLWPLWALALVPLLLSLFMQVALRARPSAATTSRR